jgi:hypothetical protein
LRDTLAVPEPLAVKVAWAVLWGGGGSNAVSLPAKLAKIASFHQPSSLLFIASKLERLSARTLKPKHPEDAVREACQTRKNIADKAILLQSRRVFRPLFPVVTKLAYVLPL